MTTAPRLLCIAVAVTLFGQADAQPSAPREAVWRAAIARTPVPGRGCFEADYPVLVWKQVACTVAPRIPFAPATRRSASQDAVGGGHDYAAVTKKRTFAASGSFPVVKGLKSETGSNGQPNSYSLQLNSNFLAKTRACAGAADPSLCRGWQQFAFSSGSAVAFIQYWLVDYGAACPAGWDAFENHCFKNGSAIGVDPQPIKQLPNLKLTATAVKNAADTLVLTTKRRAYSVPGDDKIVNLAKDWHASEFNVFGDGGSRQANFNAGTKLTVEIDVQDGRHKAPECRTDGGTSGETNNLTLGTCIAMVGTMPLIQFKESN